VAEQAVIVDEEEAWGALRPDIYCPP